MTPKPAMSLDSLVTQHMAPILSFHQTEHVCMCSESVFSAGLCPPCRVPHTQHPALPSGSPSLRGRDSLALREPLFEGGNIVERLKRQREHTPGLWGAGSILPHPPHSWAKAKGSWDNHLDGAILDLGRNQNAVGALPLCKTSCWAVPAPHSG